MTSRVFVVAIVALGASIQIAGQRQQDAGRYVAIEATVEPLSRPVPGGNAVLRVRFAPGRTPPPRVAYQTEGGTVTLADDGAGFDARAGDGHLHGAGQHGPRRLPRSPVAVVPLADGAPDPHVSNARETGGRRPHRSLAMAVGSTVRVRTMGRSHQHRPGSLAPRASHGRRRGPDPNPRVVRADVDGSLELRLPDGADGQHAGDGRHRGATGAGVA